MVCSDYVKIYVELTSFLIMYLLSRNVYNNLLVVFASRKYDVLKPFSALLSVFFYYVVFCRILFSKENIQASYYEEEIYKYIIYILYQGVYFNIC